MFPGNGSRETRLLALFGVGGFYGSFFGLPPRFIRSVPVYSLLQAVMHTGFVVGVLWLPTKFSADDGADDYFWWR